MADGGTSQKRGKDSALSPLFSEGFEPNGRGYSYSAPNFPFGAPDGEGIDSTLDWLQTEGLGPAGVGVDVSAGRGYRYEAPGHEITANDFADIPSKVGWLGFLAPANGDPTVFNGHTSPNFTIGATDFNDLPTRASPSTLQSTSGITTKNLIPPVISPFTPGAGGSIARTQTLSFNVTDLSPGVGRIVVLAYHGGVIHEVVHDGTAFKTPYATSSTKTPITNGFTFVVQRDNGWPRSALTLRVVAVDADGNEATPLDYSWTVTNPDQAAPTFDTFVPAKGGSVTAAGSAAFRVLDSAGDTPALPTGQPIIRSLMPDGTIETVYNGTVFLAPYVASSTRTGANNENFTIIRTGGWVFPQVSLELFAQDASGNISRDLYELDVTNPAPVITNFSPAPASTITATTPVLFDVTDDSGLFRRIIVYASYTGGLTEVVHDGTAFKGAYAALSTRTGISGGFQYSIRKTGGFHAGLQFTVFAIDQAGAEATATANYTISNPAPVGGGDVTPPVIGGFIPPPGTVITGTQSVTFDVTDNSGGFRRIIVSVHFPRTGIEEVVHDGDGFRGFYQVVSSRAIIANGFRYTVTRSGGWPSSPEFKVFAIDQGGNEDT